MLSQRIFGLIIASVALGTTGATGPKRPAMLVGCWHFDTGKGPVAYDSSPMGRDGKIVGAKWVEGRFGKAIQLDGVDDYVTMPGFRKMREGTLEALVNFQKLPSGQVGVLCFGNDYGAKRDVMLLGFPPGPADERKKIGFAIYAGGWQTVRSRMVPRTGRWYHLAATWRNGTMRLFINGKLNGSRDDGPALVPTSKAMLVGAGSWGPVLAATIDDVRVYHRALSAEEIASHYANPEYAETPPGTSARSGVSAKAEVSAADFYSTESLTCGIQEAVDALPNRGGVVRIPPGRYVLRCAVELYSNVTLQGAGAAAVLTRGPQASAPLTAVAKKGQRTIRVKTTTGFRIGDEVGVYDTKKTRGWYITHADVISIRKGEIVLDRPLKYDYDPAKGAGVINYYPFIRAKDVRHVTVRDLRIEGNVGQNPGPFNDFTFAAVHFVRASDSRVLRVVVNGHPSDGIGVQGGRNNLVAECVVSNCRGHGFHPGTALKWSVFSNNIAYANKADGLYFCARVRGCSVVGNVFHHNGGDGIGGLGGGGDTFNVVSNNVCEFNGRCGIEAANGAENSIAGNVCLNNSQSSPRKFSGILVKDSCNTLVTGNRCADDQKRKTQKYGIEECGKSEGNLIVGNLCSSNALGSLACIAPSPRKTDAQPPTRTVKPPAGN